MNIYSGYVVFFRNDITRHAAAVATSAFYSDVESFLDFLELTARNHELFSTSNVCLTVLETKLLHDGSLDQIKEVQRTFNNYIQY